MNRILLIIPCYNEENRLNLAEYSNAIQASKNVQIDLKFLFANDGSTDNTKVLLERFAKDTGSYVYNSPQNVGKANVIQGAYKNSGISYDSFDWIGYWDADLATPLSEVPRMIKFLDFYGSDEVKSIWGSRISRLGSDIKRQMHRHYLGRIFVTFVSNVLDVKAYDSQCGAKLFKPETASVAFANPFISKWIFDVEILLRLKSQNIVEYPLTQWEDVPGSKVKIFKELFRVFFDIFRIRSHYLKKS